MKKIIIILLTSAVLSSCSSKNTNSKEDKSKMEVGVENVNGNIPDTTNSINLSTQKKDSTGKKDSIR